MPLTSVQQNSANIQKSCESVNELPYIIQLCKNTAIENKFMKQ